MRFDVQSVLMKGDDVTCLMNDRFTLLRLVSTLPDLWADPTPSSQRMREQSCVSDASDEAVVPLDRDEASQVRNVIATACEFDPVVDLGHHQSIPLKFELVLPRDLPKVCTHRCEGQLDDQCCPVIAELSDSASGVGDVLLGMCVDDTVFVKVE